MGNGLERSASVIASVLAPHELIKSGSRSVVQATIAVNSNRDLQVRRDPIVTGRTGGAGQLSRPRPAMTDGVVTSRGVWGSTFRK